MQALLVGQADHLTYERDIECADITDHDQLLNALATASYDLPAQAYVVTLALEPDHLAELGDTVVVSSLDDPMGPEGVHVAWGSDANVWRVEAARRDVEAARRTATIGDNNARARAAEDSRVARRDRADVIGQLRTRLDAVGSPALRRQIGDPRSSAEIAADPAEIAARQTDRIVAAITEQGDRVVEAVEAVREQVALLSADVEVYTDQGADHVAQAVHEASADLGCEIYELQSAARRAARHAWLRMRARWARRQLDRLGLPIEEEGEQA